MTAVSPERVLVPAVAGSDAAWLVPATGAHRRRAALHNGGRQWQHQPTLPYCLLVPVLLVLQTVRRCNRTQYLGIAKRKSVANPSISGLIG